MVDSPRCGTRDGSLASLAHSTCAGSASVPVTENWLFFDLIVQESVCASIFFLELGGVQKLVAGIVQ